MTSRDVSVFRMTPSTEETRTVIDFDNERNATIDWRFVGQVLRGKRARSDYAPVDITIDVPDASDWDFYSIPGTHGLISQRAKLLLAEWTYDYIRFFDATINVRDQYAFLCRGTPLDCFDRDQAMVEVFPHDTERIMRVMKYSFKVDRIKKPSVFCIPELKGDLYATPGVVDRVVSSGLRGFSFERLF